MTDKRHRARKSYIHVVAPLHFHQVAPRVVLGRNLKSTNNSIHIVTSLKSQKNVLKARLYSSKLLDLTDRNQLRAFDLVDTFDGYHRQDVVLPFGRRPSFSMHGRPRREFPGPSKAVCARVLEIVFDFLRRLPLLLADLQRSVSPSNFGGQGAGKRILHFY